MEHAELFLLLPVYEEATDQSAYVKRIGILEEEEYEKLIDKIDPFNTQVFTFSDCVKLLANEYVDDGKTKALDKIAMNTVTEENVDNNNNATN